MLFVLAYARSPHSRWWRLGLAPGPVTVAALVLWAVYAFQIDLRHGILIPAPAYWESWASVLTHVSDGHQAFSGACIRRRLVALFSDHAGDQTPLPTPSCCRRRRSVAIRARRWRLLAFYPDAHRGYPGHGDLQSPEHRVSPCLADYSLRLLLIGSGVPSFWSPGGRGLVGAAVVRGHGRRV